MAKAGRPSKLNDTFLNALKTVLENKMKAFIFYDEELLGMANDILDDKDKVALSTFKEYKAGKELKSVESNVLDQFTYLIKKAREGQTINLIEKMISEDERLWQRYAWLLERKRKDLNIRHQHEVKTEEKKTVSIEYTAYKPKER